MRNKVVYIHRKETNGEIFYVGIGNRNRPYAKCRSHRSNTWINTYNKHGRIVELIHTGLSWKEACDIETDLIELIGRRDTGAGTLVNLTDGGEGRQGFKNSKETKAKMRENWTNGSNTGRSIEVIDTATGIKYNSLKTACNELGHNLTTIAYQLSVRRPQKWNTLRQLDDLMEGYVHKRDKRKPPKAMPKNSVIDIKTNKVYKSVRQAAKNFPVEHVRLSVQINGQRRRQSYNTLYLVKDLLIYSDGYELE